ncbi:hypothetical protein GCM10028895_27970 [Pontibacter rugosus]
MDSVSHCGCKDKVFGDKRRAVLSQYFSMALFVVRAVMKKAGLKLYKLSSGFCFLKKYLIEKLLSKRSLS